MHVVLSIKCGIQRSSFPCREEVLGELTDFHRKVASVLEIVRIEEEI